MDAVVSSGGRRDYGGRDFDAAQLAAADYDDDDDDEEDRDRSSSSRARACMSM
jgi:hypothetical protein